MSRVDECPWRDGAIRLVGKSPQGRPGKQFRRVAGGAEHESATLTGAFERERSLGQAIVRARSGDRTRCRRLRRAREGSRSAVLDAARDSRKRAGGWRRRKLKSGKIAGAPFCFCASRRRHCRCRTSHHNRPTLATGRGSRCPATTITARDTIASHAESTAYAFERRSGPRSRDAPPGASSQRSGRTLARKTNLRCRARMPRPQSTSSPSWKIGPERRGGAPSRRCAAVHPA